MGPGHTDIHGPGNLGGVFDIMEKNKALLILMAFFLSLGLQAEETGRLIPESEILQKTGASLRWEPLRGIGLLEKGERTIAFKPGLPYLLVELKPVPQPGRCTHIRRGGPTSRRPDPTRIRFPPDPDNAESSVSTRTRLQDKKHRQPRAVVHAHSWASAGTPRASLK